MEETLDVADPFLYVMPKARLPRSVAYETIWSDEPSLDERIIVAGIPVSIKMEAFSIEVIIEGEMDEDMATRVPRTSGKGSKPIRGGLASCRNTHEGDPAAPCHTGLSVPRVPRPAPGRSP